MSYQGNLVGDEWSQYSNDAGQVYYVEIATGGSQYEIPTGWEDDPHVRALLLVATLWILMPDRTAGIMTPTISTG